jgi:hypothetical protein
MLTTEIISINDGFPDPEVLVVSSRAFEKSLTQLRMEYKHLYLELVKLT